MSRVTATLTDPHLNLSRVSEFNVENLVLAHRHMSGSPSGRMIKSNFEGGFAYNTEPRIFSLHVRVYLNAMPAFATAGLGASLALPRQSERGTSKLRPSHDGNWCSRYGSR